MSLGLAYLAGLFDGEGTICLAKSARWATLIVAVEMTDEPTVQLFHDQWGGSMLPKQRTKGVLPHHRPRWVWKVSAVNAAAVLRDLLPYLRTKEPQAALAIEFQEKKSSGEWSRGTAKGRPLTADASAEQLAYAVKLSKLNHGASSTAEKAVGGSNTAESEAA